MKEFKFAFKNALAMIFSYIFIGFACGILFYERGINFIYAALAGIIIYAGSMQILLVPLISSSTPILIIFFTTLFVNSRHIFYGLPFVERYKKIKGIRFILMVFTMTDEAFPIITSIDLLLILGKDLFLLPSIIISSLILTFIKRRPIND